ncbi:hypothetical protein M5J07_20825 [Achromobacter mucicolens]|uniref:hypothetical protein n=1 Tax=Achromobacter mucicolens TaxID=1389922 RepID=UPI0020A3E342|nr:hypothetical protein [Achromobacter mucicolens]MCP2517396.1 hypothetical protein [Achromobacter mucicolens]
MNKEIESVIFSNVGNRLTQELGMGMVMSLAQILHQAVQAERQASAAGVAEDDPASDDTNQAAAALTPGVGQITPAAIVDLAYQRNPAPGRPARKTAARPKVAAITKTKKARQ